MATRVASFALYILLLTLCSSSLISWLLSNYKNNIYTHFCILTSTMFNMITLSVQGRQRLEAQKSIRLMQVIHHTVAEPSSLARAPAMTQSVGDSAMINILGPRRSLMQVELAKLQLLAFVRWIASESISARPIC